MKKENEAKAKREEKKTSHALIEEMMKKKDENKKNEVKSTESKARSAEDVLACSEDRMKTAKLLKASLEEELEKASKDAKATGSNQGGEGTSETTKERDPLEIKEQMVVESMKVKDEEKRRAAHARYMRYYRNIRRLGLNQT